ncbi:hypothetical protein Tco_0888664 [Tanacetum coccineum]
MVVAFVSSRDEAFLYILRILDGFLDVSFKSVKLVNFLVYLVSSHGWLGLSTHPTPREVGAVEKVKALGANGEASGSRVRVVWMVVDGGKVRTRLVSNVVAKVVLLLLRVEELALESIEYDDQDEEDDL